MSVVKWIGVAAVLVSVLVAVVVIVGLVLPQSHEASRTVTLKRPIDDVWATINDVKSFPTWRNSVAAVEVLGEQPLRWREMGKDGPLTFQVIEAQVPSRLVSEIADQGLPFGGRWIYELRSTQTGTELKITEHGEVYNPIYRFVSRFVIRHTATIDAYLSALRRRLDGGTVSAAD